MKNGWDRLRGRAEGLLGLDRLTETFRTFALLHFGFLIFNNLQTVFINTLFFRLTGGADTTLQYNLITYSIRSVQRWQCIMPVKKDRPKPCGWDFSRLFFCMPFSCA